MYADIAGLKDVNDKIVDVLNNFLTKSLFVRAQSVRFIITITLDQVDNERGKMVRDQIETVRQMCMQNLSELINSLQPIITKVDKNLFSTIQLENIQVNLRS